MADLSKEDEGRWSRQIENLTTIADEVRDTTSSAMGLFLTREDSDDWLIIDRLLLIATAARDSMRSTYSKLRDAHKRHLIAVALFELGDVSVLSDLIDAVENDQQIFLLAANKLAGKAVKEAAPAILRRLESSLAANATDIATLLRALSRLSNELPQRTYDVLKDRNSIEVQEALSSFTPRI